MFGTWKEKLGLKKESNIMIQSPIEGEACSLKEVNDPTFSEKILGDGVAIKPRKGRVVAPVDGTVALLFETKHALTILSEQGTEILIHIGLDTVKLKGEFFKSYIKTNDKVKVGDLLIEFDLRKIENLGYDMISPIVIFNTSSYTDVETYTGITVKELDNIIKLKK